MWNYLFLKMRCIIYDWRIFCMRDIVRFIAIKNHKYTLHETSINTGLNQKTMFIASSMWQLTKK
jgi:hypothetical protein